MSNLNNPLTTPTAPREDTRNAGSNVFSSPARDVGWSPSAANTPLGAMFCDKPSSAYINQVIESNVSPIRRNPRFAMPVETKISGINLTSPGIEMELEVYQLTSEDLDAYEHPQEARLSRPLPPPSTPQPARRLFQTPFPKNTMNQNMGYPYSTEFGANSCLDPKGDDGIQPDTKRISESNVRGTGLSLEFSSSPTSPLRHTTDCSPIKPRRVPTFPPPASPPPFAIHLTSPAHTYAGWAIERDAPPIHPRAIRAPARAGGLSPPSMPYPSAEPLDDDPFLVRAPAPTNDQLGHGASDRSAALGPRDWGFAPTIAGTGITSPEENPSINPRKITSSSRRSRVPKKRGGGRGGVTKNPTSTSKATSRRDEIFTMEFNPPMVSSAIHPPGSPSKSSLSTSSNKAKFQTQSSSPGLTSSDNPSTPSTWVGAPVMKVRSSVNPFKGSYRNPSSTGRSLFPTPPMTSSFGTPSTASLLPTPAHTTLFPSPEIIESPTLMRPIRGHGRLTRSQLRARHAVPIERDLIGGSKLTESTPNRQPGHYNLETEWNSIIPTGELDSSNRASGSHGVQTSANEDGSFRKGADVESLQVVGPKLPAPSSSFTSDATEQPEQSATILSPKKLLVADQAHSPKSTQELIETGPQLKRLREECDEYSTLAATKRVKVVDKSNASAPKQIDTFDGDIGSGRATRSHSRAVAALLALASSGDNQALGGRTSKGTFPGELAPAEIGIARRMSTRSQVAQSSGNDSVRTPSKLQKASNRGVVGRAPSRVINTWPSNASKFTTPLSPGDIIVNGDSSKAQARAKTGVANRDKPQGADHVSDPTEVKHRDPSDLLPRPDSSIVFGSDGEVIRRTFDKDLPIHEGYPRWYRRHPVSAYFLDDDPARKFVLGEEAVGQATPPMPGLIPNAAQHFSLYTPRFTHGVSAKKVGLCPICVEPVWRGGGGQKVLYNTKTSQYNYHMQYYHGLSAQTMLPFSPPIAFRKTTRRKTDVKYLEREVVEEGKCHECEKWIPIETVKLMDILVPEIYWWKHAASCHGASRIAGDENSYIEDTVYLKLREYEALTKKEEPTEEQASGSPLPAQVGPAEINEGPGHAETPTLMDSDSDLTDMDAEADEDLNIYH